MTKKELCDTCYGVGCPLCSEHYKENDPEIGNKEAPEEFVYVCLACGKRSKDKYGFQAITYGWDESCMLNCDLIPVDKCVLDRGGRVIKILGEE